MNNLKRHIGVHAHILSTHTHGHTLTHLRRVPLDLEAKQASVHAFVGEGPTYGCAFPSSSTCRPSTAVSGSHKRMPNHAHPPDAPQTAVRHPRWRWSCQSVCPNGSGRLDTPAGRGAGIETGDSKESPKNTASHTSQPTQPQPPPPPPLDFACQHTLPLDHHTSCMPGVVTSRPRDTIVTFPVHVLTVTGSDTPPAVRTSVVTLVPRTARPRCSC